MTDDADAVMVAKPKRQLSEGPTNGAEIDARAVPEVAKKPKTSSANAMVEDGQPQDQVFSRTGDICATYIGDARAAGQLNAAMGDASCQGHDEIDLATVYDDAQWVVDEKYAEEHGIDSDFRKNWVVKRRMGKCFLKL